MKYPCIMESHLRYVWMIKESEGYTIVRKDNDKIPLDRYDIGLDMKYFRECNNEGIEMELIKLILKGMIRRDEKD